MNQFMKKIAKDNEYAKEFYCQNCGESFIHIFTKGEVGYQPKCPNCGVDPDQLNTHKLEREKIIL